jgi:hypothetical protein
MKPWPLMDNNVSREDLDAVIKFLQRRMVRVAGGQAHHLAAFWALPDTAMGDSA